METPTHTRTIRARKSTRCGYCGDSIRQGQPIARATFKVSAANYRTTYFRTVHAYVHARCAEHAAVEWPELNGNGASS